jgi:hypothetical protein
MVGRRFTVSLMIAGSVVAGGAAGALLGVPGLSGASTTNVVNAAAPNAKPMERKAGLFDAAAKALNLTPDVLRQKLSDGKTTIADVAKQQNVDVNKVIDAMAAADRQRISDFVNNPLPARDHGPGPGRPFGAEEKFDAAAKALGITTDELRTALRDGKSMAQIAKDKNVDVNKVIDAMVAGAQARIDQAKNDGKIDQAQADRLKSGLKDRITKLVNGEFGGAQGPGRGFWGHRGP